MYVEGKGVDVNYKKAEMVEKARNNRSLSLVGWHVRLRDRRVCA